jgi:hypothetical protein
MPGLIPEQNPYTDVSDAICGVLRQRPDYGCSRTACPISSLMLHLLIESFRIRGIDQGLSGGRNRTVYNSLPECEWQLGTSAGTRWP